MKINHILFKSYFGTSFNWSLNYLSPAHAKATPLPSPFHGLLNSGFNGKRKNPN